MQWHVFTVEDECAGSYLFRWRRQRCVLWGRTVYRFQLYVGASVGWVDVLFHRDLDTGLTYCRGIDFFEALFDAFRW